jgi:rod shape-determining protein MreC
MKPSAVSGGRLHVARLFIQRFAFIALFVIAFALIVLGKADVVFVERARSVVVDMMTPVVRILSQPASILSEATDNVRDLANLRAENARLREDNQQMQAWRDQAHRLKAENAQLQALLNYKAPPAVNSFAVRVTGDTGGVFAHALLIAAGRDDGVRKGMAVISGDGLVGRVAQVGRQASRVMLITDITSRIPVVLEKSRIRGILAGNNTDKPRLLYVPAGARVAPGDRVVTSGHAGGLPAGISVGVVTSVDDSSIRIQPFMDRDRLEMVEVLDFGLSGVLQTLDEEDAEAQKDALISAREQGKALREKDAEAETEHETAVEAP